VPENPFRLSGFLRWPRKAPTTTSSKLSRTGSLSGTPRKRSAPAPTSRSQSSTRSTCSPSCETAEGLLGRRGIAVARGEKQRALGRQSQMLRTQKITKLQIIRLDKVIRETSAVRSTPVSAACRNTINRGTTGTKLNRLLAWQQGDGAL